MTASRKPTKKTWIDPDDAPDLAKPEWRGKFARADLREGDTIVKRGRPPVAEPKISVTLRLDASVLEHFKGMGPGWQTRINKWLLEAMPRRGRAKTKDELRRQLRRAG
jgi:uncharacterized protein (DUF4415 family)